MQSLRNVGELVFSNILDFEKVDFAYNTVQAWCTRKANGNPRFFSWLRGIRYPLILTDVVSLLWTWSAVAFLIEPRPRYGDDYRGRIGSMVLTVLPLAIASGLTVDFLNNIFRKRVYTNIRGLNEEVRSHVTCDRPGSEYLKQCLYMMRSITNVAAFFFSPNPLYLVNAALEGYSLTTLLQRKWVVITNSAGTYYNGLANQVKTSYFFLMQEVKTPMNSESCSLCQQEMNPSTAVYFCDNHPFHIACLVPAMQSSLKGFTWRIFIIERHENSNETLTWAEYGVSAPEGGDPRCPLCHTAPSAHELEVSVHDIPLNKWSGPATISWS